MQDQAVGRRILLLNTLAFTICFAVWTMYGVLVTFLVDQQVLVIDKAQIGWLMGIPILTGSILRLPLGLMTDRYGGKPVFLASLLFSAGALVATSFANGFAMLMVCGLLFGVAGATFSVGIAYTSVWFPKQKQGTALGIFGMGNAGSAITTLAGPLLLRYFTNGGENVEGWRKLPLTYAAALVVMSVIFAIFAVNKSVDASQNKTWGKMLQPLGDIRVWRFGLYYFLVFGCFVALAQWLVPYYLNVYGMSLAMAGLMASIFSFPSGVIRALGGWASDKYGARSTMYWVLSTCVVFFALLVAPRMDITSPGQGVMADRAGTVTRVAPGLVEVDGKPYALKAKSSALLSTSDEGTLILPTFATWQEPAVAVGGKVQKKQLVAKGITHVYFQANVTVFTILLFAAGIMMGVGKAAVYKHIPEYFPNDIGAVGGLVGVIGGLGGFVCPIMFGYMLKGTGLWTTCWVFLAALSVVCLVWMHIVILRQSKLQGSPDL
ncbi:MAG: nitrate/nitrite transporter [Fimbriimonadaceae bacterium]